MGKLFNKLKSSLSTSIEEGTKLAIVEIPRDAPHYVCKNHFGTDQHGTTRIKRVILNFLPRETERTCECGVVYKRCL